MKASGESSTTKHRLLHASGPHPIPPPNDPKGLDLVVDSLRRILVLVLLARAVAVAPGSSIAASVDESTRQRSVLVCRVRVMSVVRTDTLLECVLCLDRSIPQLHRRVKVDRLEVVLFQRHSRG
ncbi:hypothetical protein F511_39825 [Dorcoceras hygrometricum]|uniref:Uncharacterized protein n=1 Tax=Dorcoceras hygrometricum TaxID=472368 RepID=A0A2Z7CF07_9LAMI|nr:hypothetical protein F511_39825 [Dorcoceras hygrometricum]